MNMQNLIFTICILFSITLNSTVFAFETDQYNLPPEPLADIGGELTEYLAQNLKAAVDSVNAKIDENSKCLALSAKQDREKDLNIINRLAYLRSEDAIAQAFFERTGSGTLSTTKTGEWFKKHNFTVSPSRYKTSFADSIYVLLPTNWATISPTINVFGTDIGVDKIEHFLQQGYKYYRIRNKKISDGNSADKADSAAVRWGQHTERSYYGLYVSGVYSNGDLAANYAGMRFYQRLTSSIKIGETTYPPIVARRDGKWHIDPQVHINTDLLKPFITDHLNEALNPSLYSFNLYPSVKHIVRKHACAEWRSLMPDAKKADLDQRSAHLKTWFGKDYGSGNKGHFVPISICFAD